MGDCLESVVVLMQNLLNGRLAREGAGEERLGGGGAEGVSRRDGGARIDEVGLGLRLDGKRSVRSEISLAEGRNKREGCAGVSFLAWRTSRNSSRAPIHAQQSYFPSGSSRPSAFTRIRRQFQASPASGPVRSIATPRRTDWRWPMALTSARRQMEGRDGRRGDGGVQRVHTGPDGDF